MPKSMILIYRCRVCGKSFDGARMIYKHEFDALQTMKVESLQTQEHHCHMKFDNQIGIGDLIGYRIEED